MVGPCSGPGYPDKTLTDPNGLRILLEVKATSHWNPNDSNRVVLTSSSKKLRNRVSAPPRYHLVLTFIHSQLPGPVTINRVRLDFLEPATKVNVRLEASVNHKILSNGTHHHTIF